MPGPMSQPKKTINGQLCVGKTAVDRASGKSARHAANRRARAEESSNPSKKSIR